MQSYAHVLTIETGRHRNELLNNCTSDQSDFWKSIGKVGIGQYKGNKITMEVLLDDGSVSSKLSYILDKWKTDFSSLFDSEISSVPDDDASDSHVRYHSIGISR